MIKYFVIIIAFLAIIANGQEFEETNDIKAKSSSSYKTEFQSITIPKLISYQGKLVDSEGKPVNDGSYVMIFTLYNASTGISIWRETQTVETRGGLFNVFLRQIDSLPSSGACSLGIRVLPSQTDMTPRQYIASVPFAYLSDNSDKLQGKTIDSLNKKFVNEGQRNSIVDTMIQNNSIDSLKIKNGTITRADVVTNFKAPYTDTADYLRNANMLYVDSTRVSVNAYNAYKLQGKDTTNLDDRYVNELQQNAIINIMIKDSAVSRTKIGTNAVDSTKIANNTVTSIKILDGTIDSLDINDAIITTRKIKDNAITKFKLAVNSVDSTKVADSSLTSLDIKNGTIKTEDVTSNFKAPFSDTSDFAIAAPTTRPITPPIVSNEIADNSIDSAKISDNSITRQDVESNFKAPYSDTSDYARAVTLGYVDSSRVATNTYKLQGKDTLALSNKFVDENQTNAISSVMIIDNTVNSADIRDTTINAMKIKDGAVNSYKILDGTIDSLDIKDTIITTRKIKDNAITKFKLAVNSVDSTKVADNSIISADIKDSTIRRIDVANNFKAPYAETSDYVRNVNIQYVDSTRISANAHKLQGKDTTTLTTALSTKFVDEGQIDAITDTMIKNGAIKNIKIDDDAVTSDKIKDGTIKTEDVVMDFKSPLADTSDFTKTILYNSQLMGIDTIFNGCSEDTVIKSGINFDRCLILLTIGPVDNSVQSIKINRTADDSLFVGTTDNNTSGVDIPYQYFIITKP